MTTNKFPFFDVFEMFKQINPSLGDPNALLKAQQKNLEAFAVANQKIAESMHAIAQQEQRIFQESVAHWMEAANKISPGGILEEQSVDQSKVAIEAVEQGIKNMRAFAELVAQAQAENLKIVNKRVDESIEEFRDWSAKQTSPGTKTKK